jgi:hypothetical protein
LHISTIQLDLCLGAKIDSQEHFSLEIFSLSSLLFSVAMDTNFPFGVSFFSLVSILDAHTEH